MKNFVRKDCRIKACLLSLYLTRELSTSFENMRRYVVAGTGILIIGESRAKAKVEEQRELKETYSEIKNVIDCVRILMDKICAINT